MVAASIESFRLPRSFYSFSFPFLLISHIFHWFRREPWFSPSTNPEKSRSSTSVFPPPFIRFHLCEYSISILVPFLFFPFRDFRCLILADIACSAMFAATKKYVGRGEIYKETLAATNIVFGRGEICKHWPRPTFFSAAAKVSVLSLLFDC